jgi:hypothetical protein
VPSHVASQAVRACTAVVSSGVGAASTVLAVGLLRRALTADRGRRPTVRRTQNWVFTTRVPADVCVLRQPKQRTDPFSAALSFAALIIVRATGLTTAALRTACAAAAIRHPSAARHAGTVRRAAACAARLSRATVGRGLGSADRGPAEALTRRSTQTDPVAIAAYRARGALRVLVTRSQRGTSAVRVAVRRQCGITLLVWLPNTIAAGAGSVCLAGRLRRRHTAKHADCCERLVAPRDASADTKRTAREG